MAKYTKPQWTRASDGLWQWGDDENGWYISRNTNGYYLMVSSGIEYGPFPSFIAANEHAMDVMA